jgi:hypothetical protein
MEMLAFDSRYPNPRYEGWIREFREAMCRIPVIAASSVPATQRMERQAAEAAVSLVA